MTDPAGRSIGMVVIGRNEGDRLRRCLRSLVDRAAHVVYVDSGSTDDSVHFAQSIDVEVVELDPTVPFTMARGRNAGMEHLLREHPDIEYIQFVDGDCEVVGGWLEVAERTLRAHSDVGVVCGRRRERYPGASVYNRLCDLEWASPPGEVKACGGDAMMRAAALRQVGGYNATMIAGEEAELCVRLRQRGWKVLRVEAEMTLHDAAIMRFRQWWRRTVRSGHAYAEGMALHGRTCMRHNVRQVASACAWGLGGPMASAAVVVAAIWKVELLLAMPAIVAAYAVLGLRVYHVRRALGDLPRPARLYTAYCLLGKVPAALGVLTYWLRRVRRRGTSLIEYKSPAQTG